MLLFITLLGTYLLLLSIIMLLKIYILISLGIFIDKKKNNNRLINWNNKHILTTNTWNPRGMITVFCPKVSAVQGSYEINSICESKFFSNHFGVFRFSLSYYYLYYNTVVVKHDKHIKWLDCLVDANNFYSV